MRKLSRLLAAPAAGLLALASMLAVAAPDANAQNRNRISGHVFSEGRQPLMDLRVELLNEVYSTIAYTRTNGSGLFAFGGLSDGRFKVRVMPFGTDYEEQTKDVYIHNVSIVAGGGASSEQVDFYMRLRPAANAGPFFTPGTVFVQEVPKEAQQHYEEALASLRRKEEKAGFESLKRALEVFPDYFLALDRLGTEYVVRGYYHSAHVLLTKAVGVNPRSFSSTFGLGMTQYKLDLINEAVESLRAAASLYNKSVNATMWLGIALKKAGKLAQAEEALLRAREMSKGKAAQVHWQLARIYSEQKRYTEAADALELFLKHQPEARDAEKIRELIKQLRVKSANRNA
jgi:tetratricopeptide (TPR) repeat protein